MAEETFLHRWFEEVWNKGREEAIFEMFHENGIAHGLTDENGNELRGNASFAAFHEKFRILFPGIRITIEETVTEGDKIAALCNVTVAQDGDGDNSADANKPIEIQGLCLVKMKDGKIFEAWNQFDLMKLYKQMM